MGERVGCQLALLLLPKTSLTHLLLFSYSESRNVLHGQMREAAKTRSLAQHQQMQLPVPCVNHLDDEPAPSGFEWTDAVDEPDESELQLLPGEGCACAGGACGGGPAGASAAACACAAGNQLGPDTLGPDGRLLPLALGIELEEPLRECGPACVCRGACGAGAGARPPRGGLRLQRLPGKGWGVVAEAPLAAGDFVCT